MLVNKRYETSKDPNAKMYEMQRSYLTFEERLLYINEDDLKLTLGTLVATNTFMLRNSDSYTSHNFSDNTILAPETLETFT